MSVREVRKKTPPTIMRCVSCGVTQARIGNPKDWIPWAPSYLCGKKACREKVGAPLFVPPDEQKSR